MNAINTAFDRCASWFKAGSNDGTKPPRLLGRTESLGKVPETSPRNKLLLGLALLSLGLLLIPFTGGTSVATLSVPALAAYLPTTVGVGVGSGLSGAGIVLLFQSLFGDRDRSLNRDSTTVQRSRSETDLANRPIDDGEIGRTVGHRH